MKGLYMKDYYMIRPQMKGVFGTMFLLAIYSVFLKSVYFLVLMEGIYSLTSVFTLIVGNQSAGLGYFSSLPVSRKQMAESIYHVMTGYLLAVNLLCILVGMVILVVNKQSFQGFLPLVALCTGYGLLAIEVLVPMTMKYGGEHSRMILLAAAFIPTVIFIVSGIGKKASLLFTGDLMPVLGAAMFGVSLLLLPLSFRITVRIMEKMEF